MATTPPVTDKMSPEAFAMKVKEKYPQYASISNAELASKIILKHPEYKERVDWNMDAPSTYQQKKPVNTPLEKLGLGAVNAAPAIMGTAGGAAGGLLAGPAGAVAGATAGGMAGKAFSAKVTGQKTDASEIVREGGKQAAWEVAGGLVGQAGKGIAGIAKSIGIDEAMMKFALKTGEDLKTGTNPAAAIGQWQLKAATTKELYHKVGEKVADLAAQKNALIAKALPTASTLRPYSIMKGVLDKHMATALNVGDPEISRGLQTMLKSLEQRWMKGGSGKILDIQEADALKTQFGKTVDWIKKPAEDKAQSIYKAEVAVRREIYGELNRSVRNAAGTYGGRLGDVLKDEHNLLEAQRLLHEAALSHSGEGHTIMDFVMKAARRPGPTSQIAPMAAAVSKGVQAVAPQAGKVVDAARIASGASGMPTPPQQ